MQHDFDKFLFFFFKNLQVMQDEDACVTENNMYVSKKGFNPLRLVGSTQRID